MFHKVRKVVKVEQTGLQSCQQGVAGNYAYLRI